MGDTTAKEIRGFAISHQFIRFLLAGGVAAGVNFLSRIMLSHWLPYSIAIVGAFVLGLLTAFLINRGFVFTEANSQLRHQIFWFVTINLAALLQTLGVSLLLADAVFPRTGFTWHEETVAHGIGVIVPVLTSYFGHKHWTFR